jgi:DNA-directed RNA polymerase sigma subunit (sigma70/sigma32)
MLSLDEQDLLESVENDEWQSVPNREQEIQRYQSYARSQLLEEIRINLPVSDIELFTDLAQQTGTNGQPHSLVEIIRALELSRERVRQIESKALQKLHQPKQPNEV